MNGKAWTANPWLLGMLLLALGVPCALAADAAAAADAAPAAAAQKGDAPAPCVPRPFDTSNAESRESAGFELRNHTLKIAALNQFAKRAVFLPTGIRIRLQHRTRHIRGHVRHLAAAQCCEYQGFALRLSNAAVNVIVDRNCWSAIALT